MTDRDSQPAGVGPESPGARISRATFLKGAAGVVGHGAAGPLLGAAAAQAAAAAKPVYGGTLTIAYPGAGTSETLSPTLGVTPIDESRIQSLYDPLVIVNADFTTSPGLALDWTPNKTADVWEVKLRSGVTFHNGKTFGAEDVIYSIRQMAKKTSAALPFVSNIRLGDLKAPNKLTLQIPLLTPDASLMENFVYYNTWIVQNGETNYSHPVGTGPFKFASFTPGQQSVFSKNADYWQHGKPYVDTLKIVSITDPTARLNALLSGQIDGMALLPYAQAKAHQSVGDINVLVGKAPQALVFYMETTKPPFTDNRVRMAMKLIADRPALVAGALAGYGTVANDLIGVDTQYYASDLPQRHQDIAQAKSLLKAAGKANLAVDLHTTNGAAGMVETATVFANQAQAAGVKINVINDPNYYGNQYLKLAFSIDFWGTRAYLNQVQQGSLPNSPYNETHWPPKSGTGSNFEALYNQALAETDPAKRTQIMHEMQQAEYNVGGYIIPFFGGLIDGYAANVKGLKPSKGTLNLDSFGHGYRTIWFG
jgi:peptide/nickel transport system substrate-binding protein